VLAAGKLAPPASPGGQAGALAAVPMLQQTPAGRRHSGIRRPLPAVSSRELPFCQPGHDGANWLT